MTPKAKLPLAMAYALDLPGVSVANIGPYTMAHALENIELAKKYKPLTAAQRAALLAEGKQIARRINDPRPRYGPVA